jgi:hypothetical protein
VGGSGQGAGDDELLGTDELGIDELKELTIELLGAELTELNGELLGAELTELNGEPLELEEMLELDGELLDEEMLEIEEMLELDAELPERDEEDPLELEPLERDEEGDLELDGELLPDPLIIVTAIAISSLDSHRQPPRQPPPSYHGRPEIAALFIG